MDLLNVIVKFNVIVKLDLYSTLDFQFLWVEYILDEIHIGYDNYYIFIIEIDQISFI